MSISPEKYESLQRKLINLQEHLANFQRRYDHLSESLRKMTQNVLDRDTEIQELRKELDEFRLEKGMKVKKRRTNKYDLWTLFETLFETPSRWFGTPENMMKYWVFWIIFRVFYREFENYEEWLIFCTEIISWF